MKIDRFEVSRHRNRLGLSQAELADRAGISQPCVSMIETGKAGTSLKVLGLLAGVLGVQPMELVNANRQPSPKAATHEACLALKTAER